MANGGSDAPEVAVEDVTAMLKAGDTEVCGIASIQQDALAIASPEYKDYIAASGDPITVDLASATDVNRDIHEISCSARATFNYAAYEGVSQTTADLRWKLRPAAGGGQIVETQSNPLISAHANAERRAAQRAADREQSELMAEERRKERENGLAQDSELDGNLARTMQGDEDALNAAFNNSM